MDPHAMLQPVGPRPQGVYWVRRLVLLVGVTVLVVLASHACAGGGSPGGDTQLRQRADQQPLASSSPTPSTSPVAAAPVSSCRPRDLTVRVTADAATYALGVDPRFTAVVRNTGPACRFPTALSTRSWRILSGADEVWSTGDCARSSGGKLVRFAARAQITYVLPWDRFRSTPGCAVAGAPAQAGTYRLYVTIAGASGPAAVFHLAD